MKRAVSLILALITAAAMMPGAYAAGAAEPKDSEWLDTPFIAYICPTDGESSIYIMPSAGAKTGSLGEICIGTEVMIIAEKNGDYYFRDSEGNSGWNRKKYFSEDCPEMPVPVEINQDPRVVYPKAKAYFAEPFEVKVKPSGGEKSIYIMPGSSGAGKSLGEIQKDTVVLVLAESNERYLFQTGKGIIGWNRKVYFSSPLSAAGQSTAAPSLTGGDLNKLLASLAPGDTFYFGQYEQDGLFYNGKEPILWRVLGDENGKKTVISEYCLDYMRYLSGDAEVVWRDSAVREFLNGDFLDTAFTAEEKKHITVTELENSSEAYFGTDGGGKTLDAVFCLNCPETERYFPEQSVRIAKATAYAESKWGIDGWDEEGVYWLLRSPAEVCSDGGFLGNGGVLDDGLIGIRALKAFIRPAMVIQAEPKA